MDFSEIYNKFSPKIYRVCLGYVNDADQAKDLTQETFISVWENLDSFKGQAAIGTWIYRIATNKCLRQLQIEKRYKKADFPPQLAQESERTDEHQLFLRNCIATFPEIDRIIIGLYLEEIPQEQIAEIVGISHTNIRVKVHRIKEKIAKQFKAHGKI